MRSLLTNTRSRTPFLNSHMHSLSLVYATQ